MHWILKDIICSFSSKREFPTAKGKVFLTSEYLFTPKPDFKPIPLKDISVVTKLNPGSGELDLGQLVINFTEKCGKDLYLREEVFYFTHTQKSQVRVLWALLKTKTKKVVDLDQFRDTEKSRQAPVEDTTPADIL